MSQSRTFPKAGGPLRIVGLMSGTSMDAVDAAVIEIARRGPAWRTRALAYRATSYPPALRTRLDAAARATPMAAEVFAELSRDVGKAFARAARNACTRAGLRLDEIDAVASHGQTIAHRPARETVTVQIGEPTVIAERTGCTVISDFRSADTAAGGEGAPLVPYVHAVLFTHPRKVRAIQNIGGMGNVTVLDPRSRSVIGSDTGPGNVLIDEAVRLLSKGAHTYDRGGRLALSGSVDERVVARVLSHPFFRRRPPASTGREDFGAPLAAELVALGRRFGLDAASIVASITAATARSIARTLARLARVRIAELYVCGGGARNRALLRYLASELAPAPVATTAALGMNPDFVEAHAFAVLGALTLGAEPANVPQITGAEGPRVLGKITPGRNFAGVRLMARSRRRPD